MRLYNIVFQTEKPNLRNNRANNEAHVQVCIGMGSIV